MWLRMREKNRGGERRRGKDSDTHTRAGARTLEVDCYSTVDGWMVVVAAAGGGLYNLIWI